MVSLQTISAGLNPITLGDLPSEIDLMERYDTKLTGPADALRELVDLLGPGLRVLEVEGNRVARVTTNYFDTPDLALYGAHAKKRRRRYKVRVRRYEEREGFLEVKLKTDRRQTVKYRTPYEGWDTLDAGAKEFIATAVEDAYGMAPPTDLAPVLSTSFLRSTLVDVANRERVTLDLELGANVSGREVAFRSDRVIVEAKSDRTAPRATRGLLRLGFRAMPMSKYCMALTCARPELTGNEWRRALSWFEAEVVGESERAVSPVG